MAEPVFLMSHPRPDWGIRGGANFLSSMTGDHPPSPRLAMLDWLSVADTIEAAGGRVLVLPPPSHLNLTGLPYTAEAGEFHLDAEGRPCFILSKMKSAHRQPEPTFIGGFAAALGWKVRGVRAVWEAQGDAIRIGQGRIVHTYGKGPMRRTEPEAYAEVADQLSERHIQIEYVAYPWFHGNTFMAAFHSPDEARSVVVVCPDALPPDALEALKDFCGDTPVIEIDRAMSLGYATNALQVNGVVIAPAGLDDTMHAVWRELGLRVIELSMDELFRRGGGAAVCLSNRLYGLDPGLIPAHLRYGEIRGRLGAMADAYPDVQAEEGW